MRILIGYNNTDFAKTAIEDLVNAGLPADAEALILTLAGMCAPTVLTAAGESLALEVENRVRALFPGWKVSGQVTMGSPQHEILASAETFRPDLIVLGGPPADPRSGIDAAFGALFDGLLADGNTAMRITRKREHFKPGPPRLIVGFDGSEGAERAVAAIASREWPKGTSVRLLSIDDTGVLGSISRLGPQMRAAAVGAGFASHWAETLASNALELLRSSGIEASIDVRPGRPQTTFLEAADEWNADCIFIAASSVDYSSKHSLIGAVAAQANCTVEIVR